MSLRTTAAPRALAVLLASCLALAATGCAGADAPGPDAKSGASRSGAVPGADPITPPPPSPTLSEAERVTSLPTGPKAEFRTRSTLDDGTTIDLTTLVGKKSGFTGKVWVWTPKQYADPAYAKSGFPVLVALPGGPGYPDNYWIGGDLQLQQRVTEWSKQGRSLPFIIVMPVLNPDSKHYYDGADIPGQPKMGTWLTEDVPDLVRANFRTFKDRDGWAFLGASSGAFAGLNSVLRKPDRFKAVVAAGPDTEPDSPLWRGHENERDANNPEKLAAALLAKGGPDVYLAFDIGASEGGIEKLRKFIANYGKGPVKTRLHVIQGGAHSAKTYVRGFGEGSLEWISKQLRAPIADPAAGASPAASSAPAPGSSAPAAGASRGSVTGAPAAP
ncbi:alpha/beta hydrolase [Streptomyces sp. BI20]|uniref:alpha/beta hydrolase n=1 Tax=Streptomyces sp. BI20 TaxID=3403460 RepID=UPI003C70EA0F